MTYLIYLTIILLNLYYSFLYKPNRIKKDNEYNLIKEQTIRKKIYDYITIANIIPLIINIIIFITFTILKININIIDIIGYIIHSLSFLLLITTNNFKKLKESKKFKIHEKNKIKFATSILYTSLIITQRIGEANSLYSVFIYISSTILLIILIGVIIRFLLDNKKIVGIKYNQEKDYLQDIKFINKICINNIFYYTALIFIYILLISINFPYIWIGYILICVMLLYIIIDKIKKFKHQSNKLTKTIYILKNAPGVEYAFDFYKDILSAKKVMLATILFIISIITYYLNTSAFSIITIELFIYYYYIYLIDKKNLISYISSLNENFIDKEIYTLEKNFPISYIDEIKIFNVSFYKIIYMDLNNNIYSSNLILYDPENILNNIKVYLNPYNPNKEYIMIIKELYE